MSFRSLLTKRWFLAIVIALLSVFVLNTLQTVSQRRAVQKEIEELQTAIRTQEQEKKQYQQLLDKIRDFTYIEREARVKFALKAPGENVFVVPDELLALDQSGRRKQEVAMSNPQRWWNYFFE